MSNAKGEKNRKRGERKGNGKRKKKTRSGMHNRGREPVESRARRSRLSVLYYRK